MFLIREPRRPHNLDLNIADPQNIKQLAQLFARASHNFPVGPTLNTPTVCQVFFYVRGIVPHALHARTPLNLQQLCETDTVIVSHFTHNKTDPERLSDLSKVTQLVCCMWPR